jgi:hypothetical protein
VCSGGFDLAPTQPFGEPHERERGEGRRIRGRGELFQGTPSIHVCPTLLQRDPFIGGWGRVMSHRTRWETPRGRYDEHNIKFSLSMKPKFNRPVEERNHF